MMQGQSMVLSMHPASLSGAGRGSMEALIFVGLQASGKSTFYKERFFTTHLRINLDMLRTRHRERLLIGACLEAKQPFVVDNTNPNGRGAQTLHRAGTRRPLPGARLLLRGRRVGVPASQRRARAAGPRPHRRHPRYV